MKNITWLKIILVAIIFLLSLGLFIIHYPFFFSFRDYDSFETIIAAKLYNNFSNNQLTLNNFLKSESLYQPPPLIHILQFLYYVCTNTFKGVVFLNLLPVLLISYSMFKIARIISNPQTAILAVFITFSLPSVIYPDFTNCITPQFFLSAIVSFAIYHLIASNYFQKRKNSLLFGFSVGIAALTKITFPLYFIGPLCLSVFYSRSNDRKNSREFRINLALALTVAIFIAGFWYFYNMSTFIDYLHNKLCNNLSSDWSLMLNSLQTIFLSLWEENIERSLSIFFICVISLFILRKLFGKKQKIPHVQARGILIIISSIIITPVLLMFFGDPERFYGSMDFIVIAPFLSFLISEMIFSYKNKYIKNTLLISVVVLGVLNHIHIFPKMKNEIIEGKAFARNSIKLLKIIDKFPYEKKKVLVYTPELSNRFSVVYENLLFFNNWYGNKISSIEYSYFYPIDYHEKKRILWGASPPFAGDEP